MKIGLRCIFALLFYVFVWAHAATVPTGLHGGKEWMGLHDIRQEDTVKIVRDIIENKGQPISRSLFESAASGVTEGNPPIDHSGESFLDMVRDNLTIVYWRYHRSVYKKFAPSRDTTDFLREVLDFLGPVILIVSCMAVVVLLMAGLFRIGSRSWLPERTAKLSSYLFLSALILVAMYLLSLGVAERPWMMFLIISVVLSLVIGFTFIYFSTDRIGRVIGLRDNTRWIMIILVIFAIIVVAIWLISRPLSGLDGNNLRTMKLMARIDTRVVQSRHGYWYLRGGGGESDYQLLEVIHPSVVNVISAYNKSTDRIGVLEKEFFDRIKNLTTTINDRNKFDRTYRARKGLDDVALKEAKRILNGFDERIRIRIGVINEYNQYAIKDEAKLMEMFVRLKRINDLLLVEMSAAKTYPEKERPRSPVNVPTDIIDVDQYDIELTKRLNEIRKMVEQD